MTVMKYFAILGFSFLILTFGFGQENNLIYPDNDCAQQAVQHFYKLAIQSYIPQQKLKSIEQDVLVIKIDPSKRESSLSYEVESLKDNSFNIQFFKPLIEETIAEFTKCYSEEKQIIPIVILLPDYGEWGKDEVLWQSLISTYKQWGYMWSPIEVSFYKTVHKVDALSEKR